MKTIITFLAIFISLQSFSQEAFVSTDKQLIIEEYINHFERNNRLMGNISISENGQEIINRTFGSNNLIGKNIENKNYTIGSITKMFTALVFVKLSEEGKINLEEKLSSYFPQIPNADKINLNHMLRHTSGLGDYVVKNDSLFFWLKEKQSSDVIIHEIIRQDVSFQPGEDMAYSNSAYYLLARILEKTQEQTFAQVIEEHITTPLGLKNTLAYAENTPNHNTAKSFERSEDSWVEMEEFHFLNASGAGDIMSTAIDLNKFLHEVFSYKLVSKENLEVMLPVGKDWFGLGIMKVPFYDYIAYGHGGDTYGTHSVISYNPNNKIAISYIINGEHYPTNDFAIGLLSIIYDKEYTLPSFEEEFKADKSLYTSYQGTYGADGFPIKIKVFEIEGALIAQGDGQPPFTLTPADKHVFEFKDAGIKLKFMIEDEKVILMQAGQEFELIKI